MFGGAMLLSYPALDFRPAEHSRGSGSGNGRALVMMYGRDERDWERLANAGLAFLIERARLAKVTSHTELNATIERRTGLRGFDFGRADERAAMGNLLYLIVEQNRPVTNLMISALVTYLDANDAGTGFYAFAHELGLLPRNASAHAKFEFWMRQVQALHEYYSPHSRLGSALSVLAHA
jgi:hypothetical protein